MSLCTNGLLRASAERVGGAGDNPHWSSSLPEDARERGRVGPPVAPRPGAPAELDVESSAGVRPPTGPADGKGETERRPADPDTDANAPSHAHIPVDLAKIAKRARRKGPRELDSPDRDVPGTKKGRRSGFSDVVRLLGERLRPVNSVTDPRLNQERAKAIVVTYSDVYGCGEPGRGNEEKENGREGEDSTHRCRA